MLASSSIAPQTSRRRRSRLARKTWPTPASTRSCRSGWHFALQHRAAPPTLPRKLGRLHSNTLGVGQWRCVHAVQLLWMQWMLLCSSNQRACFAVENHDDQRACCVILRHWTHRPPTAACLNDVTSPNSCHPPPQVSPLRYTGRVVMVRDHFGFIQCQDLPTEADEVSRWGHKAPGEGEDDGAPSEPPPKPDAAKRKKKPGNRFQIFFSLAEVEGETELRGGDEVEFVVGVQKGERVARRVRFKSRPAPLPEPSATPLGERRKLFANVRRLLGHMCLLGPHVSHCNGDACYGPCVHRSLCLCLCAFGHRNACPRPTPTDATSCRRCGAHPLGGRTHPKGARWHPRLHLWEGPGAAQCALWAPLAGCFGQARPQGA